MNNLLEKASEIQDYLIYIGNLILDGEINSNDELNFKVNNSILQKFDDIYSFIDELDTLCVVRKELSKFIDE